MTDDIVTNLRHALTADENPWDATLYERAADEIERLRAELSRLMQIICDASPDDDYLLVRKECDAIWEKIHMHNERA